MKGMREMKLGKMIQKGVRLFDKKAPELLSAAAIVGLVTTGIWAYKAGKKVKDIMDEKRQDMDDCAPDDHEAKREVVKETVKEMAPVVVPPVAAGVATVACIIGSNRIQNKRIVALSAAYSLSESALHDLNEQVRKVVGDKKASDIKDEVAKEKFKREQSRPDFSYEEVVECGHGGGILCMDGYTHRMFRSSYEAVNRAIMNLQKMVFNENWVTLNDFYSLLGIDGCNLGDDVGFSVDDFSGMDPIHLTSMLADNGEPALVIEYDVVLRNRGWSD